MDRQTETESISELIAWNWALKEVEEGGSNKGKEEEKEDHRKDVSARICQDKEKNWRW